MVKLEIYLLELISGKRALGGGRLTLTTAYLDIMSRVGVTDIPTANAALHDVVQPELSVAVC